MSSNDQPNLQPFRSFLEDSPPTSTPTKKIKTPKKRSTSPHKRDSYTPRKKHSQSGNKKHRPSPEQADKKDGNDQSSIPSTSNTNKDRATNKKTVKEPVLLPLSPYKNPVRTPQEMPSSSSPSGPKKKRRIPLITLHTPSPTPSSVSLKEMFPSVRIPRAPATLAPAGPYMSPDSSSAGPQGDHRYPADTLNALAPDSTSQDTDLVIKYPKTRDADIVTRQPTGQDVNRVAKSPSPKFNLGELADSTSGSGSTPLKDTNTSPEMEAEKEKSQNLTFKALKSKVENPSSEVGVTFTIDQSPSTSTGGVTCTVAAQEDQSDAVEKMDTDVWESDDEAADLDSDSTKIVETTNRTKESEEGVSDQDGKRTACSEVVESSNAQMMSKTIQDILQSNMDKSTAKFHDESYSLVQPSTSYNSATRSKRISSDGSLSEPLSEQLLHNLCDAISTYAENKKLSQNHSLKKKAHSKAKVLKKSVNRSRAKKRPSSLTHQSSVTGQKSQKQAKAKSDRAKHKSKSTPDSTKEPKPSTSKGSESSKKKEASSEGSAMKVKFNFQSPRRSAKKMEVEEGSAKKTCRRRLYTSPDKKEKRHNTSGECADDGNNSYATTDSADSDDDGERLHMDLSGVDVDEKLAKVEDDMNLTARHVKSLLYHILTNEDVLKVMQGLMDDANIIGQPRMTRSKIRHELEKVDLPSQWPSPIKSNAKEKKFIDLELDGPSSEEEDYQPTMSDLEGTDDDDVSFTSGGSDLGSPRPRPGTPKIFSPPRLATIQENSALSPQKSLYGASMTSGEVDSFIVPPPLDLNSSLLTPSSKASSPVAPPALRTRSKFPLKDVGLEELEKAAILPDDLEVPQLDLPFLDPDPDSQDKCWLDFLANLHKTDDLNTSNLDEEDGDDPMYNFMNDALGEQEDPENLRVDRGVDISKKERNALMDELFEWYDAEDSNDGCTEPDRTASETCDQPVSGKLGKKDKEKEETLTLKKKEKEEIFRPSFPKLRMRANPKYDLLLNNAADGYPFFMTPEPVKLPDEIPVMTASERNQLQDQLRKYVQLASQSFVMSLGTSHQRETAFNTKHQLMDLMLRGEYSPAGEASAFKVPNVELAVHLVMHPPCLRAWEPRQQHMDAIITAKANSAARGKAKTGEELLVCQMHVFATSPIFLFPQMLPDRRFVDAKQPNNSKQRVRFTEAEDHLLAMGRDLYGDHYASYRKIQEQFLPTKEHQQLRFRAKNLRSRKGQYKDNPIRHLVEHGCLPEYPRYDQLEPVEDIVRPVKRHPSFVPLWMELYKQAAETDVKLLEVEEAKPVMGLRGWYDWESCSSSDLSQVSNRSSPKEESPEPQDPREIDTAPSQSSAEGESEGETGPMNTGAEIRVKEEPITEAMPPQLLLQDRQNEYVTYRHMVARSPLQMIPISVPPPASKPLVPKGVPPQPPPLPPPKQRTTIRKKKDSNQNKSPRPIPTKKGKRGIRGKGNINKEDKEDKGKGKGKGKGKKSEGNKNTVETSQKAGQHMPIHIQSDVQNINPEILYLTQEQMDRLGDEGAVVIAAGGEEEQNRDSNQGPQDTQDGRVTPTNSPDQFYSMPEIFSPLKKFESPRKSAKIPPGFEATLETVKLVVHPQTPTKTGFKTPEKYPRSEVNTVAGIGSVLTIPTPEKCGRSPMKILLKDSPGKDSSDLLSSALAETLGLPLTEVKQQSPRVRELLLGGSPMKEEDERMMVFSPVKAMRRTLRFDPIYEEEDKKEDSDLETTRTTEDTLKEDTLDHTALASSTITSTTSTIEPHQESNFSMFTFLTSTTHSTPLHKTPSSSASATLLTPSTTSFSGTLAQTASVSVLGGSLAQVPEVSEVSQGGSVAQTEHSDSRHSPPAEQNVSGMESVPEHISHIGSPAATMSQIGSPSVTISQVGSPLPKPNRASETGTVSKIGSVGCLPDSMSPVRMPGSPQTPVTASSSQTIDETDVIAQSSTVQLPNAAGHVSNDVAREKVDSVKETDVTEPMSCHSSIFSNSPAEMFLGSPTRTAHLKEPVTPGQHSVKTDISEPMSCQSSIFSNSPGELFLSPQRPMVHFKEPVTPGLKAKLVDLHTDHSTLMTVPSLDSMMDLDHSHDPTPTPSFPDPSVLVTPTKAHFEGTLTSPYKPSPKFRPYSSPPDTPETPTKHAVRQMQEAAQNLRLPTPRKYWSPSASKSEQGTPKRKPPREAIPDASPSSSCSSMPAIFQSPMKQLFRHITTPKTHLESEPSEAGTPTHVQCSSDDDAQTPTNAKSTTTPDTTPTKNRPLFSTLTSPSKQLRFILPKPGSARSPRKQAGTSPMYPRSRGRRRKTPLRSMYSDPRAILPRGAEGSRMAGAISPFKSPSKLAAASITARARRCIALSPRSDRTKKSPSVASASASASSATGEIQTPPLSRPRRSDPRPRRRGRPSFARNIFSSPTSDLSDPSNISPDPEPLNDLDPMLRQARQSKKQVRQREAEEQRREELREIDDAHKEEAQAEEEAEEDHLAKLMAASTNIGGAPDTSDDSSDGSQSNSEVEQQLELLAPDLVEADPKRDEKEISYGQSYLQRVREALKDEDEKYAQFLVVLDEFLKNKRDTSVLHEEVASILADHKELLADFSPFLQPGDAHDAGELQTHMQHNRVAEFIRKIEIVFRNQEAEFDAVMRLLVNAENMGAQELEQSLRTLLHPHPHLLPDLECIVDARASTNAPLEDDDLVEVASLGSSNDGSPKTSPGSYEEAELHEDSDCEENLLGSLACRCHCHRDMEPGEYDFPARRRHCIDCGLKMSKGQLVLKTGFASKQMLVTYPEDCRVPTSPDSAFDGSSTGQHSPEQDGEDNMDPAAGVTEEVPEGNITPETQTPEKGETGKEAEEDTEEKVESSNESEAEAMDEMETEEEWEETEPNMPEEEAALSPVKSPVKKRKSLKIRLKIPRSASAASATSSETNQEECNPLPPPPPPQTSSSSSSSPPPSHAPLLLSITNRSVCRPVKRKHSSAAATSSSSSQNPASRKRAKRDETGEKSEKSSSDRSARPRIKIKLPRQKMVVTGAGDGAEESLVPEALTESSSLSPPQPAVAFTREEDVAIMRRLQSAPPGESTETMVHDLADSLGKPTTAIFHRVQEILQLFSLTK